jgi:DNA-binding GntR family transcriptional regulator
MTQHLDGMSAGKPVPGEVELAAECHVSRTIVRKVLERMEAKGLVRWADGRRVLARRVLPADAPPQAPEPLSREQQVARFVLEKIARNELQPGQSLSEKGIATELGVSTGPVREAMLTLAPLGLIRKRARRQWEVAALNGRQWEDLMELRALIEGYCLDKLLVGGVVKRHRSFLEQQRVRMRRLVQAPTIDFGEFLDLDLTFHRWLISSSDNQVLIERNRFIYVVIEFQMRNSGYGEDRARLGARQHVELIEALLAGESERARAVLKAHLEAALTTLRSLAQARAAGTQMN